jgi:hypothetical protein
MRSQEIVSNDSLLWLAQRTFTICIVCALLQGCCSLPCEEDVCKRLSAPCLSVPLSLNFSSAFAYTEPYPHNCFLDISSSTLKMKFTREILVGCDILDMPDPKPRPIPKPSIRDQNKCSHYSRNYIGASIIRTCDNYKYDKVYDYFKYMLMIFEGNGFYHIRRLYTYNWIQDEIPVK